MLSSVWQRLDLFTRHSLPAFITVVFTLAGVVALPLPYFGQVAPPFALIGVYYWAIHRPDLLGPGVTFFIGILNDILHALPIGLSALLFVGMHQLVFSQRRFFAGHSFFMMWWGFAFSVILVLVCEWGLLSLFRWQWVPPLPVLLQAVMAIVLFPLPCWLLIRMQRAALSTG